MLRTAIIAIARNEDLYLGEWVDYHLSLGFDRLIIALNDDVFNPPLSDPKVTWEDFHGVQGVQPIAYRRLYKRYRGEFDWILFLDIDEFLVMEYHDSVGDFLEDFNNGIIRLNELHYGDGEMLDVIDGNYQVFNRFLIPGSGDSTYVKSFINTRVDVRNRMIYGHGIYDPTLDAVNALGEPCGNRNQHEERVVLSVAWINHYRTKTVGEYVRQKLFRGGANRNPGRYTMDYFWRINRRTPEKEEYANKLINELKR